MARRWRHEELTIASPSKDGVLLAVIADTHSKPHRRAAELIAKLKPDHILHAGDIGDVTVLDAFGEIAPTTAVRGNIDPLGLPDSVALDVQDGAHCFGLLLTHIAVAGPKLRADAAKRAKRHDASMVVCGHSHVPFIGRDRGLVVFNPGSIGPRRFSLPITFGVMRLSRDGLSMRHVDCETGDDWMP